jgi:prepilin peptidase CpaA
MAWQSFLICVPMLAALILAAVIDLRYRRIPNWLSLALVAAGIFQSFLFSGGPSPTQALAGLGVGFALPFILFAMGALGGGDVKLLAGVGAWMGATMVFQVFLAAALVGMVMVLAQATAQGRLTKLFRNSAVLSMNLMNLGDVSVKQAAEYGQDCRSIDRPLPYAVPVLLGCVLLMIGRMA